MIICNIFLLKLCGGVPRLIKPRGNVSDFCQCVTGSVAIFSIFRSMLLFVEPRLIDFNFVATVDGFQSESKTIASRMSIVLTARQRKQRALSTPPWAFSGPIPRRFAVQLSRRRSGIEFWRSIPDRLWRHGTRPRRSIGRPPLPVPVRASGSRLPNTSE